jgi:hypothetical protein
MGIYMGGRLIFETSHEVHKASSPPNHVVIWKYITGMDRRSVRGQTVLSLSRPFNTGYRVKYPFFAVKS